MTQLSMSPAPAIAATASPASSPATAAPETPGNFLTMLSQLLNAPAPVAAAPVQSGLQGPAGADDELEDSPGAECGGLAALLAFVPPAANDSSKLLGALKSSHLDAQISEILGRTAGGNALTATDAALLNDLMNGDTLANAEGKLDQIPFGLMSEGAGSRSATALDAAMSRPVHVPVGTQAWADEIGSRITMMAEHGKQAASLRLSPEHLGPLEIRIAISSDQASVWFGAAHADTRAAIEQALPRLRELFEAQGMSLTDAGVFHEAPRDQQQQAPAPRSPAGDAAAGEEAVATTLTRVRLGLVDAYA